MAQKPVSELLYDSEATLRLVDSALVELRGEREEPAQSAAGASAAAQMPRPQGAPTAEERMGLIGLTQLLAKGYAEIVSVLGSLRQSRSVLERAAVEKLQHTHAKLREVTTATEVAATDILDGLDRSVAMVDRLDSLDGAPGESAEVRAQLRDELFNLMGCMQFQDITTQQLNYASSVLTEMEERLAQLASIFDPAAYGAPAPRVERPQAPVAYDPGASVENAEQRQAVADEIFTARK